MDNLYVISAMEAILFAAGDPVPVQRIAQVLGAAESEVYSAAQKLQAEYAERGSGIRLLLLDDKLQLCSAPEHAQIVTMALEQRKPPRLSPAALEVLAIVAYFQPVTRAYIDQIRGVDSAYTVSVLMERGLIEACGRLEVPGRPTIYRTGDAFLRTMNISTLEDLPQLPDMGTNESIVALQNKIEALQAGVIEGQMSLDDESNP